MVRAYLLKEDFQFFWQYTSAAWAGKFLDQWCARAMRSRLKAMKRVARMLRRHRELILNWFRARKAISAGAVEGLNNKAKVGTKQAYGFHTYSCLETALYHRLGDLPEPAGSQSSQSHFHGHGRRQRTRRCHHHNNLHLTSAHLTNFRSLQFPA